jgi:hypothetical protein
VLKVFENFVHYPPYLLLKKMSNRVKSRVRACVTKCATRRSIRIISRRGRRAKLAGVKKRGLSAYGLEGGPLKLALEATAPSAAAGRWCLTTDTIKFSLFLDLVGGVEKVCAWIDETPFCGGHAGRSRRDHVEVRR